MLWNTVWCLWFDGIQGQVVSACLTRANYLDDEACQAHCINTALVMDTTLYSTDVCAAVTMQETSPENGKVYKLL
jgi:hypothetical protein